MRSPVCLRDIRIQPDVKSSWDFAAADILATTDDSTWQRTHKATNSRLIWRATEIFVSFCVFAILGNKDGWLLKQCVPVPSRGGWRGHSRGSGGAIQSLARPHGGGAGRVAAGGRHPGLGGRQLPHQIRWLRMCRSLIKRKNHQSLVMGVQWKRFQTNAMVWNLFHCNAMQPLFMKAWDQRELWKLRVWQVKPGRANVLEELLRGWCNYL